MCFNLQKNWYFRQANLRWAASWENQQSDCVPSEDSDQPGHPMLIWVFAGSTVILLVFSRGSSYPKFWDRSAWANCSSGSTLFAIPSIWASSRKNLSSGVATRADSNRPAQLQRLDRGLQFWIQKLEILYYLGSEQQRCWTDSADMKADLCLCCSHMA